VPVNKKVKSAPLNADALTSKYFNDVSRHKLPTLQEERRLFTAYKDAQTKAEIGRTASERTQGARDRAEIGKSIACGYLRFVILQARRKTSDPQLLKDLISQGNVGLMLGISKFDLAYGVRFLTYAASWIDVCMQEYLHKLGTVHVPSHTRKEMRKRRKNAADLEAQQYEEPQVTSIANVTLISDIETDQAPIENDLFQYMMLADLTRAEQLVVIYAHGLRGNELCSEDIAQLFFELDGSVFSRNEIEQAKQAGLNKIKSLMAAKGITAMRDFL
jgi:hypothetical protein